MPPATSPPSTPPRHRQPSPASPSEAFWPIHHSAEPSPPATPVPGASGGQWMPPTPISLRKAAMPGFATSKTAAGVGDDDGVGRERYGHGKWREEGVPGLVLWWDANLVGIYCPYCLHLETHLTSSVAADSHLESSLRQANCDVSKVYRILYPYEEHPATEGLGDKCDETGHHETTGLGDILLPLDDARDDDGFIDISEWDGEDGVSGEGLERVVEDGIQHVGRIQRSAQRDESPSPRIPSAIESDTKDDDLGFLSNSDDEEENHAGRSKTNNRHREDDESIIVVDNNGARLPKILHFNHGEQSPTRIFSQEDRAPSALISEALAALPRRDGALRVRYEGDGLGIVMKDRDRTIVDREDDDSNSDGIAEIAASKGTDRHEPSIAASPNGSSSFIDPISVSSTSPPAIPSNVSPYLTLRPPNLKSRTLLYGYMADIPSSGACTKTVGISTVASSPSSTPAPALPFSANDIAITRSGYHRTTSDDPRIFNNIVATAAVRAFCAEIGFPLKAHNMDKDSGIGQVNCSHVEKQLIVHAVLQLRTQKSSDGGVRQSPEQSQTAEQLAADEELTKRAIFIDREPCPDCNEFREAVEARFPLLKFTFTTIQRAEITEMEKKKKQKKKGSVEKAPKTRANRRLSGDEESSMLPSHVPRTPKKPAQQMVRRDSGYASAPKDQLERSSSRKRRASSPCEMAERRARRLRDRGLVSEEWDEEFVPTLVEDESEDAESADGDDEVQRAYDIRRRSE